jgi:hypothetical protein
MLASDSGYGRRSGEDVQGQLLPPTGREELGGAGTGAGGRDRIGLRGGDEGRSLGGHVCSVRVMALAWNSIASMEGAGIRKKIPPLTPVLPGSEPGRITK